MPDRDVTANIASLIEARVAGAALASVSGCSFGALMVVAEKQKLQLLVSRFAPKHGSCFGAEASTLSSVSHRYGLPQQLRCLVWAALLGIIPEVLARRPTDVEVWRMPYAAPRCVAQACMLLRLRWLRALQRAPTLFCCMPVNARDFHQKGCRCIAFARWSHLTRTKASTT